MRFLNYLFFIGNVVTGSYLAIIEDTDGENNCRVWSQNNHACTGYSATFAKLEGKDCSSFIGAGSDDKSVKVDICGTENGEQVAWVTVNKNGTVSFLNRQGDTSSCMLENGLEVPSGCSVGNTVSSQATTPISTGSQTSFSTAIGTSTFETARADLSPTPIFTPTPKDSQSLASTSASESATETPLADQSPTPVFTSTSTNSESLASTSAGKFATETPLAEQSPTLTPTPACACSCKSAVI
ncbi:uncharacterized protein N7511_004293 [Penicillium nucicola]|uniref:uncharacterized protein n=1 Tax=Penicillium nucicola TaxID=1850975 RepID=UPI002544DAD2|nr:uncharacterized protein N7511_004293 [Penicillium nucicola]KAJ5766677.1 hypothetical protein N7511_004293 [Penicillium nucicola]